MTDGDEVLHGDDYGEGLDLSSNAALGHFGGEVGDFPEAVQHLFAVQAQGVESVHGTPGQVGLFLEVLHAGTMLEQVGADTGFGVGGGVGVEAGSFGGLMVGHGSGEDQVSKGYFLIGNGIADFRLIA